jgi:hypothetical protein
MGRVGKYVFNRIGYHVGSLTWVPRQSTRAGGSIWLAVLTRPDRPETFRPHCRPDIPHAELRLGELIAATPQETNLERDLGDQPATSADDQRAEPAQPQVPAPDQPAAVLEHF